MRKKQNRSINKWIFEEIVSEEDEYICHCFTNLKDGKQKMRIPLLKNTLNRNTIGRLIAQKNTKYIPKKNNIDEYHRFILLFVVFYNIAF